MVSAYYDSSDKDVSDGNVAYAADLNDINAAVDTALQLVEADITTIESNQSFYTDLAQKWAENPEDTEVTTGAYSALHWAAKANDDAVATAADRVQTGLDVVATAADRVQTGLDATATAADRVQTGLDAVATAADRVQTGLDVVASAGSASDASDSADAAAASLAAMSKDDFGGVPGLTMYKINFMNAIGTIKSFFTNSNTAERTYTFQNRNGTIADDTDLALKAPLASPALTGTPTAPTAANNVSTTQIATMEALSNAIDFDPGVNNYVIFKGGFVVAWGSETANAIVETEKDHAFPIAFTSVFSFVATPINGTAAIDLRTYTLTEAGFKSKCSLAGCAFRYIVIGYRAGV